MVSRRLFRTALRVGLCGILLSSCQTAGIVGAKPLLTAPESRGSWGLTSAERETLISGPAQTLDPIAALYSLVDASSDFQLSLRPRALHYSGLLDIALNHAPEQVRSGLDRLNQDFELDLVSQLDMLSVWGSDMNSANGFIGIAAYSQMLSAQRLATVIDAIGKQRREEAEATAAPQSLGIELTLLSQTRTRDIGRLWEVVGAGGTLVERLELAPSTALGLFKDKTEGYYYAYIWPQGLRLERLAGSPATPLEAAVRRALEFIRGVESGPATRDDVPAVRARFESADGTIFLQAFVSMTTDIALEVPLSAFGGDVRLKTIIENWDRMREVVRHIVAQGPYFAENPQLQELVVQAIETGTLTESLDGVRLETSVETELLVDGLGEINPD